MNRHKFDGERSGSGETCLAEVDGVKCYQREGHQVHQVSLFGPEADAIMDDIVAARQKRMHEQRTKAGGAMSNEESDGTAKLVVEVLGKDAEQILFNEKHGNWQAIQDSAGQFEIISVERMEEA